jgi:hypothetical protein
MATKQLKEFSREEIEKVSIMLEKDISLLFLYPN